MVIARVISVNVQYSVCPEGVYKLLRFSKLKYSSLYVFSSLLLRSCAETFALVVAYSAMLFFNSEGQFPPTFETVSKYCAEIPAKVPSNRVKVLNRIRDFPPKLAIFGKNSENNAIQGGLKSL